MQDCDPQKPSGGSPECDDSLLKMTISFTISLTIAFIIPVTIFLNCNKYLPPKPEPPGWTQGPTRDSNGPIDPSCCCDWSTSRYDECKTSSPEDYWANGTWADPAPDQR